MSTGSLADKIRAFHPSARPHHIATVLGCCPRYVSSVRWRMANPDKVKATAKRGQVRRQGRDVPLVIAHGDPRHAAWCQFWRNEEGPAGATRAAELERFRRPIEVRAHYPPPSPDVHEGPPINGARLYTIPRHTPEWAALVAYTRRQGPRGAVQAQAMLTSTTGRPALAKVRWAPFDQEGAPDGR
jgi:hypothetical protein